MKKSLLTGLVVMSMVFCTAMSAMAWDYSGFGTNITDYDGNGDGTTSGWHKGTTSPYGTYEDNEVEAPNAIGSQSWDMEAFFWNGTNLTMVGGYDIILGEDDILPGHIFIDSNDNGSYDYAIAFTASSATAYTLTGSSSMAPTTYFPSSDPWKLNTNGEVSNVLSSTYYEFAGSVDGTDITGGSGTHNAISINLSGLTLGTSFSTHFTMACGNDNLIGRTNTPIPGAVWLLGSGLMGLIGVRRRRK